MPCRSGWCIAGRALIFPLLLGVTLWGALALLYASSANALFGAFLSGAFTLCGLAASLAPSL